MTGKGKEILKVAAVIPTYNERENIRGLVPIILEVFRKGIIDGGIIIVDDASPDGTGVLADELARSSDRIMVLKRPGKMGLGSAYKDGFNLALSKGYNGVIEIDADLSHNPADIPRFVEKLGEGYDLVIGSRYVEGGQIPKWSLYRKLISGFTNKATKFFLGLRPQDVTSGFRAYSDSAIKTIDLSSVKSDGYAFQVEMTLKSQKSGLKICEIPIAFIDREAGTTKLGRREMWRFLTSIIRLTLSQ